MDQIQYLMLFCFYLDMPVIRPPVQQMKIDVIKNLSYFNSLEIFLNDKQSLTDTLCYTCSTLMEPRISEHNDKGKTSSSVPHLESSQSNFSNSAGKRKINQVISEIDSSVTEIYRF